MPLLTQSASHERCSTAASGASVQRARVTQHRLASPAGQPDLVNLEQTIRFRNDSAARLIPSTNTQERVEFEARIPVRTAETVYDDEARTHPWPERWPEWVRPAIAPRRTFPATTHSSHAFSTTGPAATRAMPPALLAKHLAKRIIDSVQPNGLGVVHWERLDSGAFEMSGPCDPSFNGFPGGLNPTNPPRPALPSLSSPRGPVNTLRGFDVYEIVSVRTYDDGCFVPRIRQPIERGRANPAIIANLYVSLLRASGIPARVVIGTEISAADLRSIPNANLPRRNASDIDADLVPIDPRFPNNPRVATRGTRIRFWTEFYLFDERTGTGQWIPVDLHRQRAESSRAPDIHRPWRYFGNHDELDEIVPLTSVYTTIDAPGFSGIPALWGWATEPERSDLRAPTVLLIEATGQPRRANDGLDPRPRR